MTLQARQPRFESFENGSVVDGRYELVREIGQGAAGAVFEARHLFTGRFVAVKVLLPHAYMVAERELRARIEREARALASIRHPGVVEIFDGGITLGGSPYIVMEMLQGRSLEALVTARGRLGREDTIGLGLQLCSALSAVHRAGVVHRDVKPMNMVVVRDAAGTEQVKLVDFGIVRAPTTDERLTGIGTIIGTPAYMSPEQLMGLEDLDGAADVYSAGVTLFECLSGEVPYPGSYPAVLTKVSSPSRAPSVRDLAPDVDPGLAAVVDRAIAKSRIERFGSAEEMAEALRSLPGASSRTTLLGPSPAAGAPTVEQRRQWRRAAYNTPVRIVLPDGVIDGRSDDVSEGGMLVIAREGCEPGQRVGLRFALPMEGKVASVEANVRWVRRPGAQCALGLEFVLPPAHVRSSIARYVALMSESASVRPGSAT